MNAKYIQALRRAGACRESVRWAKRYTTPQIAWSKCDWPGWMFWYLGICAQMLWFTKRRRGSTGLADCRHFIRLWRRRKRALVEIRKLRPFATSAERAKALRRVFPRIPCPERVRRYFKTLEDA